MFANDPRRAEDLGGSYRYNAARAAALAACGLGKDADHLDTEDCASLRKQALDWLRADVTAWSTVLQKDKDKAAATKPWPTSPTRPAR